MEVLTTPVNLCEEILKEMKLQEIDESIIELFTSSEQYKSALSKSPQFQRPLLISILFRILLNLKVYLSPELRKNLNIDSDINDWLTSIKINIIPFIKLNSANLISELRK